MITGLRHEFTQWSAYVSGVTPVFPKSRCPSGRLSDIGTYDSSGTLRGQVGTSDSHLQIAGTRKSRTSSVIPCPWWKCLSHIAQVLQPGALRPEYFRRHHLLPARTATMQFRAYDGPKKLPSPLASPSCLCLTSLTPHKHHLPPVLELLSNCGSRLPASPPLQPCPSSASKGAAKPAGQVGS